MPLQGRVKKKKGNFNFLYCRFLVLYFKSEISFSSKSPNHFCELEIWVLKILILKRIYQFIQLTEKRENVSFHLACWYECGRYWKLLDLLFAIDIWFLKFTVPLSTHAPHWFRGKQNCESRNMKSLHIPSLWWEQVCGTNFLFCLELIIPKRDAQVHVSCISTFFSVLIHLCFNINIYIHT